MSDNKDNVESTRVSPNSNVILDEFTGIDIPDSAIVNPSGDSKDIKLNITMNDKSLTNSTTDNVNDNDKPKTNGIDNLRPFNTLTEEEHRELAKKGGKASGESRKQRKTMKENLKLLLECEFEPEMVAEITGEFYKLAKGDNTVQNTLMIQTLKQAMSGDTKAIALVRDTIGEKPIEESVVTSYTPTPDDMEMISNVRKRLGLEE